MAIPAGNDHSRQEAEVVRANLAQIGITVEVKELDTFRSLFVNPDAEVDFFGVGLGLYYPDPATFLWDMLVSGFSMPASWLPDGVAEQVDGLVSLTGEERVAAAVALADDLAIDEVPVAAMLYGVTPALLGPEPRVPRVPAVRLRGRSGGDVSEPRVVPAPGVGHAAGVIGSRPVSSS